MRTTLGLLFAVAAAGPIATHAAPSASELAWLSGDWHRCRDGEVVEERWLGPRGEMLLGANLTTSPKRAASHESLRIARDADGTWTYWAAPMGRAPVPFRLVESGAGRAVFANPEHGFPARVVYWRDGVDLLARIEGTVNGRADAVEWRFAPGIADCRASP
jgi:hypothetical protein